jgi:hypothetical protein
LYRAIFDRVVALYPLPEEAAQQLAAGRAKAIRDYLVESTGTTADRVETGQLRPAEAAAGNISTALELFATKSS